MVHYTDLDVGQADAGYLPEASQGSSQGGLYRSFVKRGLDVAVILLAAPVVLFVVAVLALLVKRDGGPVLYCQDRLGRNGKAFRLWKLRSMVVDADARLAEHLAEDPAALAEWTETQKLKNDPRITAVGRVIRKTSLDELPQLWNVLVGDMSLVGPRPMLPEQAPLYPGRAYYELRPGLTGFWQISDRNRSSFAGRATFDTRYNRRLSLGTDLRVLFMTAVVVLRGTGY
jgi:lipopolysaccharide/colanic/teichoic acid biosynthesis glycosyltransferase